MKKQKEFNLTDDKFNEENNTLSYNQLSLGKDGTGSEIF